jgi:uncharacterized protein (TIGR02186 family)
MCLLRNARVLLPSLLLLAGSPRALASPGPDCEGVDPDVHLHVDPATIPIGMVYGGTEIHVTADLPAEVPVAVVLEGGRRPVTVKKKGKVWHLLWMSVGEATYQDLPSVYLLSTSAPLQDLADPETLAQANIGYASLARSAGGDAAFFDDVIALEEQDGVFSVSEGGATLRPSEGGATLEAVLPIHPHVPEGRYPLRLVAFEDGAARCVASTTVAVEQVGLVKKLRILAFEHGLLYGITAVLVALFAGLATGLVFGKSDSGHH